MDSMLEATVGSAFDGSATATFESQGGFDDVITRFSSAIQDKASGFELSSCLADTLAAAVGGTVFSGASRSQIQAFLRVVLSSINSLGNVHGYMNKVGHHVIILRGTMDVFCTLQSLRTSPMEMCFTGCPMPDLGSLGEVYCLI